MHIFNTNKNYNYILNIFIYNIICMNINKQVHLNELECRGKVHLFQKILLKL